MESVGWLAVPLGFGRRSRVWGIVVGYKDYLRSDATGMELDEVLRSSPGVLLGVGPDAAHALSTLGIATVFDLAGSSTFGAAATVLRVATDGDARSGALPGDLFAAPTSGPIEAAPDQSVGTLRLVAGAGSNGAVSESLDVHTIRDLALWPPYAAARSILAESVGAAAADADGTPGDLLPGSGRYPLERAYYSSFILADLDDPTGGTRSALEDAGPLDPVAALSGSGFSRPVRGARLTFAQSWYSQGVALGQLLHSLALAPGESTRVAMIDWSRQQTGTQLDTGGQTEALMAATTQKRAMSEVQNAVATEAQNGFSQTASRGQQTQGGGGGGFSAGGLTVGGSGSTANTAADSSIVTGSSGVRSIAASMTQNVADSTDQAASSARNMYASVVRELSQAEHENISTRVVGNFNHMHALTVQYYEVVQIYRTSVGLHRFEPCLFVPMKPIDFLATAATGVAAPGDIVVRRYRNALQAAALDPQTRTLLDAQTPQSTTVEIRPTVQRLVPPAPTDDTGSGQPAAGNDPSQSVVRALTTADGSVIEVPEGATLQKIRASFPCKRAGLYFPEGSPENTTYMNVEPNVGNAGQPFEADGFLPVPLGDVVSLTLDTDGFQQTGFVTLVLAYRGAPLQVDVPVVAYGAGAGQGEQVLTLRRGDPMQTLKTLLAQDQLHYSQVVWRAMDSATVALLLAPYTYAGQPLAQVVDPAPVGVTGNYLIFRMPWEARDLLDGTAQPTGVGADQAWTEWIGKHADYQTTVEDFVPLPSGGVFAEAVLGRANCAEKLDITRFWNWQDSPVPLQAPDIAAVQAGSRAQQDSTTPSGLAAPIVAFNNPAALPDPAGLSSTLGALASGAMFRDMSGSATAQALALAAITGAGQGATAAGQQGVANAAMAAQKDIEMAKIAAGLVTGGLAGGGKGTASVQGAKINEGRSLDERGATPTKGGNASGSLEAQAAADDTGTALAIIGDIAGAENGGEKKVASPDGSATDGTPTSSGSSDSSPPAPSSKSAANTETP